MTTKNKVYLATSKDLVVIKYIVTKATGERSFSYSQAFNEYLEKGSQDAVSKKVMQDIKFYRNSNLGKAKIDVFVGNKLYKQVTLLR